MTKEVIANLLDAPEQYICHQCNCVSDGGGAGLAVAIFNKWPYADVYTGQSRRSPGTIEIRGNGKDQRFVIALYGQYYPGSSQYPNDAHAIREKWFQACLDKMLQIPNIKSIAFPWRIGCGIAGGNWETYLKMIEDFSEVCAADVAIYRRPEDV